MVNKYTKIAEMIKETAEERKLDIRDLIRQWVGLFEESRVVGFSREEFMDACIEAQTPKDNSLSSKRWGSAEENDWNYDEEELKSAIKELKDEFSKENHSFCCDEEAEIVRENIDKIFGPKLTKELSK